MELQKFSAQRFRSLSDLEMFPSAGMNVVYGENAQGKTNLLEAVFVLSTLRSFRTRYLPEVLQFGESSSLVQGMVRSIDEYASIRFMLDCQIATTLPTVIVIADISPIRTGQWNPPTIS